MILNAVQWGSPGSHGHRFYLVDAAPHTHVKDPVRHSQAAHLVNTHTEQTSSFGCQTYISFWWSSVYSVAKRR